MTDKEEYALDWLEAASHFMHGNNGMDLEQALDAIAPDLIAAIAEGPEEPKYDPEVLHDVACRMAREGRAWVDKTGRLKISGFNC